MKDIARELGVSVATVSRALNDSPSISQGQRERIQAFARDHNFLPNAIGAALRHSKVQPMKVIGVIVPQAVHYYFMTILAGIEERARKSGYNIMVAQSHERYEEEVEICESFHRNKVCGIIVSQAKDTHQYDHFLKLQQSGIPLVFYDRICTGLNCSRVVVDDYMGAYNAVTHLINTGCKRIAYYGSPMNLEISKNRYQGFHDALMRNGLEEYPYLVRQADNRLLAEQTTEEIIVMAGGEQGNPMPDGIFATNDDTAIGTLYTLKRHGFRVPNDVSICGFTNGERAIACDPTLTSVEQRGKHVGEEAADILIRQVEGELPPDQPQKRIVKTKLIVRGTTR